MICFVFVLLAIQHHAQLLISSPLIILFIFFSNFRFVSKSCTLETLSLSANPKLSNADWVELLEAANQWEQGKLAVLVFNGCNVQGPLSTAFIDAINDKLNHAHPLRHVEFTCTSLTGLDTDTLRDVWLGRWADDGRCSFENGKVVLSTAEGHHH